MSRICKLCIFTQLHASRYCTNMLKSWWTAFSGLSFSTSRRNKLPQVLHGQSIHAAESRLVTKALSQRCAEVKWKSSGRLQSRAISPQPLGQNLVHRQKPCWSGRRNSYAPSHMEFRPWGVCCSEKISNYANLCILEHFIAKKLSHLSHLASNVLLCACPSRTAHI